MDQRTFGALAGDNIHALASAFERRFAVRQRKLRARTFPGMAFVATVLEDRFDVAAENDGCARGGRELGFVYGGG